MSLKQPSRELEVTIVASSRIQELLSCVMTLVLDINSRPSTLHNQNSLIKRKNRTLIDMAKSMLSEYNVSQSFWDEAINTAFYYIEREETIGALEW
jgi:hypothetical protein